MLKELLKSLYKAKPELIEEHKRLVDTLRSGSKKDQLKEAKRQLKELKEMVGKADRCWEGYEPVPGKKPYEKGSCAPVKKEEGPGSKDNPIKKLRPGVSESGLRFLQGTNKEVADVVRHYAPKFSQNTKPNPEREKIHREVAEFVEQNKNKPPFSKGDAPQASTSRRSWKIKIKGKPGYHEVKDVLDMGSQKHNSYVLHDGTAVDHSDVEDLDISGKTSYAAKSDIDDKIAAIKSKHTPQKEKTLKEKIKDIKEQHADKPQQTEEEKIANIKEKYSKMLKSDSDAQALLKKVSQRQPTDAELEILLEYISNTSHGLAKSIDHEKEDDTLGH